MIIATHRVELKHVPVSLLFCFICSHQVEIFCTHSFPLLPSCFLSTMPHTFVLVCVREKSLFRIQYYDEGKDFSIFLFSSLRKSEKSRREKKQNPGFFFCFLHNTKLFVSKLNLILCVYVQKHFIIPKAETEIMKNFAVHLIFFFDTKKFLHGFKYGPGRGKKYGTQLNRPKTRSRLTWMLSKREGEEKREKFFFTTLLCFPSTNTHANKNFLCRPTAGRERNEHSKHPPKGCLVLHGDFSRENSYTHTRTNLSLSLDSENSLSHFFPYKFFLFCFQTKDYFSSFPTIIAHFTESR